MLISLKSSLRPRHSHLTFIKLQWNCIRSTLKWFHFCFKRFSYSVRCIEQMQREARYSFAHSEHCDHVQRISVQLDLLKTEWGGVGWYTDIHFVTDTWLHYIALTGDCDCDTQPFDLTYRLLLQEAWSKFKIMIICFACRDHDQLTELLTGLENIMHLLNFYKNVFLTVDFLKLYIYFDLKTRVKYILIILWK